MVNSYYINGCDGKKIFLNCWENVPNPKGIIHIFHGMAEHSGRYGEIARYLNSNGFIVYASDHRGHGKTVGDTEEIGYVGEDGFNRIIEDQQIINEMIKNKYVDIPIFVFGHSFGSFVAQEYLIRYGREINGVILSGSALMKGIDIRAGSMIARIQRMIYGEQKKSNLIDKLSFGNYNKRINDTSSKFGWLSSDIDKVREYEEDPLCGTVFTTGFFFYLFNGVSSLYRKDRLESIPKNIPILILSGKNDPVGKYGKSVQKLYNLYRSLGVEDLNIKLYESGRHEMINEVNKDQVFEDILLWLSYHIYSKNSTK